VMARGRERPRAKPKDAADEALRLRLGGMTADKAIAQSGATCTGQALNKRAKRRRNSEQAAESSRGKRPCVEAPGSPPVPTESPTSNPPTQQSEPKAKHQRKKPFNLTSRQVGLQLDFNAEEKGKEKAAFKEATNR